mgnify:CR=1 FL=1
MKIPAPAAVKNTNWKRSDMPAMSSCAKWPASSPAMSLPSAEAVNHMPNIIP